jgi:hypothetical protein
MNILNGLGNLQSKKWFMPTITALFSAIAVFCFFPHSAKAYIVDPNRQEISGDPGSVISSQFNVTNTTSQPQTFYISVQNFEAADETGNPKFVDTKEGLSIWTSFPASVTAAAHGIVNIPFKVTIPKDADPGGYSAGIFAATQPPSADSSNVSIGSRVGMLLLFDVNGNITDSISILEFGTQGQHRFYSMLPIDFYYRFQNSGADRIKPLGDVLIVNMFGHTTKILDANWVDGNVLPKSIRRFESGWFRDGGYVNEAPAVFPTNLPHLSFFGAAKAELINFAFGLYTAHLNLAYGNTIQKSAIATFTFFIFPWQLIIIVVVLLLALWWILKKAIKRYNRYIIQQAQASRSRGSASSGKGQI